MNFPSTHTDGANAAVGDVISNVESSHGVRLSGGSTGGIVEPVGDDANISLRVRGKGTGGLIIGSGTAAFKGAYSQDSTYSHAAINPNRQVELTFASTTVDINTGDLFSVGITVATANLSSVVAVAQVRLSTVATSRVTVTLANISSTATSTGSGTLHLAWLDLS